MWRRILAWAAGVSLGVGFLYCTSVFVIFAVQPIDLNGPTIWNADGSSTSYHYYWHSRIEIWTGRHAPFVEHYYRFDLTETPLWFVILPVVWLFVTRRSGSHIGLRYAVGALVLACLMTVWFFRFHDFGYCPFIGFGIIVLVVVLVLVFNHPSRAQRRLARGLCPKCGYDVRATPEGGTLLSRCPECGTVI